jgi:hypothetical protein
METSGNRAGRWQQKCKRRKTKNVKFSREQEEEQRAENRAVLPIPVAGQKSITPQKHAQTPQKHHERVPKKEYSGGREAHV